MLAAIAPIAVKALGSEDKKVLDADIAEMAPSLQGAFSGLSGDKLEHLCRKLLVEHQNISVVLPGETSPKLLDKDLANEVFCGDIQDMFILMWYVIQVNFGGFFQESRRPIWSGRRPSEESPEYQRYGSLDLTQFTELEMRMYVLIKARLASMTELKEVYTLDEALKLYALYQMENDVEACRLNELRAEGGGGH